MIFEIRMTACDRPIMLKRALESIQSQSFSRWRAIVFDDSTTSASRDVVESFGDRRFAYYRNPQRRGAVKNVDQCFSTVPLLGGTHGCLLEDDNFWFPNYLSSVADCLQRQSWSLVQANQRLSDEEAGLRPADQTTRGGWFPQGRVDPLELRATLLLMEWVSNSGLVWRLGGEVDLRIGDLVPEAGLNEYCRSLLVRQPFCFIEEPHAAYTIIPRSKSARAGDRERSINRGMQSIRNFVLSRHGSTILQIANELASRHQLADRLEQALAYSGHPFLTAARRPGNAVRAVAKGLAVRILERDPCAAFLQSGLPAVLQ
jgi:hypothetical protein